MTEKQVTDYLDEMMSITFKLTEIQSPSSQLFAWQTVMTAFFERIYNDGSSDGFNKGYAAGLEDGKTIEKVKISKLSKNN
jgi:hypothetical protein